MKAQCDRQENTNRIKVLQGTLCIQVGHTLLLELGWTPSGLCCGLSCLVFYHFLLSEVHEA